MRHFFDLDATFGRGHESHATGATVNYRTQIQFALHRVHVFAHQHAVHRLTASVCLIRHQAGAEQVFRHFGGFICGFDHFHATGLAAATRMHLGFDHGKFASQTAKSIGSFFRRVGENALLYRQAILGQQFLGLILVQIHLNSPCIPVKNPGPAN